MPYGGMGAASYAGNGFGVRMLPLRFIPQLFG